MAAEPARVSQSEHAPDVALTAPSGEQVRLSTLYTERPLVLALFGDLVNPFTGDHAAQLRDAHEAFERLDVDVIAVASATTAQAVAFREQLFLSYPLLSDEGRNTYGAFHVEASGTFVVDTQGLVRFAHRPTNLADYPPTTMLFAVCSEITGVEVEPPPPARIIELGAEMAGYTSTAGQPASVANYTCPKCGYAACERQQVSTASGMLSRMFNLQNRRFMAVICNGCGYTELYRENSSAASNVVDFLTN
ncbi:MAG: zinc ribbon domain-containing protein [Dehalococcoidia bacterium]